MNVSHIRNNLFFL